jgi:hypothetical protein
MEALILRTVRSIGIGSLERDWGSLEEYLEIEWDMPVTRAVRMAAWVHVQLG